MPRRFLQQSTLPLGLLVLLAGCIDVPHPFSKPDKTAQQLAAQAPPARLDIPTPTTALLPEAGAQAWAKMVSEQLLQQTIPAMPQAVRKGDWWLQLRAEVRGDTVVPLYTIMTPKNTPRTTQEGTPVPTQAWSSGDPAMLNAVALDAAPRIAAALTGIQADDMEKDPHSLKHRPARVYFPGVVGAPGDGNIALAQAFTSFFRKTPDTLQNSADNADFTVKAHVTLTDGPAGTTGHPQQHIEIVWQVLDKTGKEAGAATQLHDIDAHSLDHFWGDVAVVAAQEAAAAVDQILDRYSGRGNAPLAEKPKTDSTPPTPTTPQKQ